MRAIGLAGPGASRPLRGGQTLARVGKAFTGSMVDDSQSLHRADGHAALIVAVAGARDRAAFAALFRHFAPRIKSMMLRSGAPAEQAEVLTQEAMLTVWRKAGLFDPRGASASGWIFRIAQNLRIDALRHTRREKAIDFSEPVDDPGAPPDAVVDAGQVEAHVRRAIRELSPEQLQVVVLSFFESRPHAEIAALLQLPLGTVKSRLRLAFKRLRALLDEVAP